MQPQDEVALAGGAAEQRLYRVYPAGVVLRDADDFLVGRRLRDREPFHCAERRAEADEQAAAAVAVKIDAFFI